MWMAERERESARMCVCVCDRRQRYIHSWLFPYPYSHQHPSEQIIIIQALFLFESRFVIEFQCTFCFFFILSFWDNTFSLWNLVHFVCYQALIPCIFPFNILALSVRCYSRLCWAYIFIMHACVYVCVCSINDFSRKHIIRFHFLVLSWNSWHLFAFTSSLKFEIWFNVQWEICIIWHIKMTIHMRQWQTIFFLFFSHVFRVA